MKFFDGRKFLLQQAVEELAPQPGVGQIFAHFLGFLGLGLGHINHGEMRNALVDIVEIRVAGKAEHGLRRNGKAHHANGKA